MLNWRITNAESLGDFRYSGTFPSAARITSRHPQCCLRLNRNWKACVPFVLSRIDRCGTQSSLMIVPVPRAVPSVALTGDVNRTKKVSSASKRASLRSVMRIVCEVSPAANVTVPVAA